jgi:hypothetical protein
MVSQILHLILCIRFHGLGLLARFVATNFRLRFYFRFRFVHALSQLLLHSFLLSPFDKAWSQVYIAVLMLILVVLAFKLPYIYDYITMKQQAEIMKMQMF